MLLVPTASDELGFGRWFVLKLLPGNEIAMSGDAAGASAAAASATLAIAIVLGSVAAGAAEEVASGMPAGGCGSLDSSRVAGEAEPGVAAPGSCGGAPSKASCDIPLLAAGFGSELNVVSLGHTVGGIVLASASAAPASVSATIAGAGSDEFDSMLVVTGAATLVSIESGAARPLLADAGVSTRSCLFETVGESTSGRVPMVSNAAKPGSPDIVLVFFAIRPALPRKSSIAISTGRVS